MRSGVRTSISHSARRWRPSSRCTSSNQVHRSKISLMPRLSASVPYDDRAGEVDRAGVVAALADRLGRRRHLQPGALGERRLAQRAAVAAGVDADHEVEGLVDHAASLRASARRPARAAR